MIDTYIAVFKVALPLAQVPLKYSVPSTSVLHPHLVPLRILLIPILPSWTSDADLRPSHRILFLRFSEYGFW